MNINKVFFSSVIPSVLLFAGLSTINVAYPVVALMQAIGTGIGMGGANSFFMK